MATAYPIRNRIKNLKLEYDRLRLGKESLLKMIEEAEISESVYNSNAIENSTLTLPETEKILLEMEVSRDISLREVFEAKNLARVTEYMRLKSQEQELSKGLILFLHQILLTNIDDYIAGRFREGKEFVRVGTHIAPAPDLLEKLMENTLLEYSSDHETYFIDKISKFHLDFETIHPFNDGNGRIGRVIMNWQLARLGFPEVIIRDKGKGKYYQSFKDYRADKKTKTLERITSLIVMESLHKRLAYLKGQLIIPLVEYAKKIGKPAPMVLNSASRQTIPAFRERGVWKIGEKKGKIIL